MQVLILVALFLCTLLGTNSELLFPTIGEHECVSFEDFPPDDVAETIFDGWSSCRPVFGVCTKSYKLDRADCQAIIKTFKETIPRDQYILMERPEHGGLACVQFVQEPTKSTIELLKKSKEACFARTVVCTTPDQQKMHGCALHVKKLMDILDRKRDEL
uniref:Uncharacterized protein n=1 Tax=Plectus sambesii TaxID=2011161 RepID=A0A914VAD7_9BILA